MSIDLSKIKGLSDEVKEKLAKVTNKEELDAVLNAENLSEEQLKELSGGDDGCWVNYCWDDIVCCPIDK